MPVADTSIDAYHAMTSRDLNRGKQRVLDAIQPGQDYSRTEIARVTGLAINVVCGRVNELIEAGALEHGPRRPCRVSGVCIKPVRLPSAQRELI